MKYSVAVLIFSFSMNAFSEINFTRALPCDGTQFVKTPEEKIASLSLGKISKEQNIKIGGSCLGWTNRGEGNIWYTALKSMSVFAVDVNQNQYLGSWEIGSFPEHLNIAGEYSAAANVIAADHGEDALDLSNPLRQVVDRPISYFMSSDENIKQSVGCYENAPLRYGDLEGDNQKELILLIGKNIVVFSPQLKKVTFSMHYQMDDEMSEATAADLEIVHNKPTDPQYLASSTEDAVRIGKGGLFGAWRSFTKMYIGHFSSETTNDVIVWRKLYQSRLVQDPIKGFEKKGDVFVHYQLVDGEYKKQPTESNVVKGWLTAKNLTWKKGYPSKSECTGQEGQFIPEMHDPLLNDPDVLQ